MSVPLHRLGAGSRDGPNNERSPWNGTALRTVFALGETMRSFYVTTLLATVAALALTLPQTALSCALQGVDTIAKVMIRHTYVLSLTVNV